MSLLKIRWQLSRSCQRMQFKNQKKQLLLSFATLLQLISCPHANPEVGEDPATDYKVKQETHRHAHNHTFSKSKSTFFLFKQRCLSFIKCVMFFLVIHKIGKNKPQSETHRHARNHTFSKSKSTTTTKSLVKVSQFINQLFF